MYRFLFFLCCFLFICDGYAQQPIPIKIKYFRCIGARVDDCASLNQIVNETIRGDQRFRIVTNNSETIAAQAELELQRQEDFLEGEVTEEEGTQEIAPEIVWQVKGNYRHRTGIVTFQLFQEGATVPIASQQVRLETGLLKTVAQQKEYVVIGLKRLLAQQFSVSVPVVKVLEGSKNKARVVLIAGGSDQGFYPDLTLSIYHKDTPNQVIGRLEVIEVEGGRFSQCQVLKGGREITQALNSGTKLIARE